MTSVQEFLRRQKNTTYTQIQRLSPQNRLYFFFFSALFFVSFLFMLSLIQERFLVEVPKRGGDFTEGVIGRPAFINPVLAFSDADRDLAALIFSGLMRKLPNGELVPDLAENVSVSEDGETYTVTLKENIFWHDGEHITADDVIFTVNKIKDPLIKSPKRANWEGVEVQKTGEREVIFTLSENYVPFAENLTTGIIPEHIWSGFTAEDFINNSFNTEPVGSGPYSVQEVKRSERGEVLYYDLVSFSGFTLGEPYIPNFRIRFYGDEEKLKEAWANRDIEGVGGGAPLWTREESAKGKKVVQAPLTRVFAVFLNQTNAAIFIHKDVREALNVAAHRDRLVSEVLSGYGVPLFGPLPPGSYGYKGADEKISFDIERAKAILSENGWSLGKDGVLEKTQGKEKVERLSFSLATANIPELKKAAEILAEDWRALGADVQIKIFEIGDLNQQVIRPRDYDALLFGEVLGQNPDPYAFWHSSQRLDPGLNIALYANKDADDALENIRSETEDEARLLEFYEFQDAVREDIPAIFLYTPDYLYLVPSKIKGFVFPPLTLSSDRFLAAHTWFIESDKVWKFLTNTN